MLCTTLYYNKRYGSGVIYHMVNMVHVDGKLWAILDNNFDDAYQWDDWSKLAKSVALDGRIWLVGLRTPGPPPIPKRPRA